VGKMLGWTARLWKFSYKMAVGDCESPTEKGWGWHISHNQ